MAVLFGCERCRSFLEHKEFELHCDNSALCWLLRRVKDVGRLARWILRLASFKFRVKYTRETDNVVADALSRMFEGGTEETPENCCMALWQELPLVYSSLEVHQEKDSFCKELRGKILAGEASVDKFQVQGNRKLLSYYPKGTKRRRWVIPVAMKMMILKYFHDSVLSGRLGARKTFQSIAAHS